jgi:hypothetical protein
MMKELRQKTLEWLRKRFGEELYDDMCYKQTVEYAADYFLENHSKDEIEECGGLSYALESWFEEYTPAEEMETMYNEKQIEMFQENACAWNEGRPHVYTEEEIWEAE